MAPPPRDRRSGRHVLRDVTSRYLSSPVAAAASSSLAAASSSSSPKYYPYSRPAPPSAAAPSSPLSDSSAADENHTLQVHVNATGTPHRRVIKLFHHNTRTVRNLIPDTSPDIDNSLPEAETCESPLTNNRKVRVVSELWPADGGSELSSCHHSQRKGARAKEEDVHRLRMLENHLLRWRFANAKAQAADHARRSTSEKLLCGASAKIEDLRESVALKRIEFEKLKREENLSTIIEAHMPRLLEWAALEGDYSTCISGTIKALQDALNGLPATDIVKTNTGELKEALNSATRLLGLVSINARKFVPQVHINTAFIIKATRRLVRKKLK